MVEHIPQFNHWKPLAALLLGFLASHIPVLAQGDLDGDSVITVKDLAILTEHLKGAAPLAAELLDAADIDRNGTVNEADRKRLVDLILLRDISPYIPQPLMEGGTLLFPSIVSAGEFFEVAFGLTNTGASVIDRPLTIRLWLSKDGVAGGEDDLFVGTYDFTGILQPGGSISGTQRIQAPLAEGDYWLVVEVDAAKSLGIVDDERRFAVGTDPISIVPPYTVQVSARENVVAVGNPVLLSGSAVTRNGAPAPFSPVSIRIRNHIFSRDIVAITDASGRFETEWTSTRGDAGSYEVGAAHQGAGNFPVQDSFRVLNLEVELASHSVRFAEGGSATISGTVRNPSDVSLSGFSFSAPGSPPGLDYRFSMPEGGSLAPGQSKDFSVAFHALPGTSLHGTLVVFYECNEGVRLQDSVEIQVAPELGSLAVSSELPLYEGVVRGVPRNFSLEIVNQGENETGPIQVSLPNLPWLDLLAVNPLPSIPPGGSGRLPLRLRPEEETPLTAYTGNLYLEPASGNGLSLPFEFRVVSDRQGGLAVTVEDELTYFTPQKPHVAGATVKLRDPVTKERIASVVTPESGGVTFPELAEGSYYLEVSSPSHTRAEQLVEIKPGRILPLTVFIQKDFVTYHWNVVPVEIRDQYRITIESVFETNVPAPVVVVSPASIELEDLIEVGDTKQIELTFTNIGLIQAENSRLALPSNPYYEFLLPTQDLGTIPALSSVTVPMVVRRTSAPAVAVNALASKAVKTSETFGDSCQTVTFDYGYWCGIRYASRITIIPLSGADGCPGSPPPYVPPTLSEPGDGSPSRSPQPVTLQQIVSDGIALWNAVSDGDGSGGGSGSVSGYSKFTFSVPPPDCFSPPCPFAPLLNCLPGLETLSRVLSCGQAFSEMYYGQVPSPGSRVGCLGLPWMGCVMSLVDCTGQSLQARQLGGAAAELVTDAEIAAIGKSDLGLAESIRRFSQAESPIVYYYGDRDVYFEAVSPAAEPWSGEFFRATDENSSGGRDISEEEWDLLEAMALADGLNWDLLQRAVARWDTTEELRQQGIRNEADAPAEWRHRFIAEDVLAFRVARAREGIAASQTRGHSGPLEEFFAQAERVRAEIDNGTAGVCARVTMQISQTAALTRTAFEATLRMSNNVEAPMEQVGVDLEILDDEGSLANDRFSIEVDFTEGVDTTGGYQAIHGGSAGTFRWTLIPREDAAPDGARLYRIGGTISFFQEDEPYVIPVTPAEITVEPDAQLHLKYFHQRDVIGDDPHTGEIEPSEPFTLAVLVENRGAGAARNLSITSAQPQIVENEKGLAVDFKILATQVAGAQATPSLEANFGEIPAGESRIAAWQLSSSLQGLFIDYQATFEHVDRQGDPRLSLIRSLEIHEMIRMLETPGSGQPAFLANDLPDAADLPDTVHLSDGSTAAVEIADAATVLEDNTSGDTRTIRIQIPFPAAGWSYLRIPDPAGSGYTLKQAWTADGGELSLGTNVWQSDRTFLGLGFQPRREHLLHLADLDSAGEYTLQYEALPTPDLSPPSSVLVIDGIRNGTDVILRWEGEDDRGVAAYDVYVSIDGGAYALWLKGTRDTSAVFQGEPGSTYSFYTLASDAAGNLESAPPGGGVALSSSLQSNQAPWIEPIGHVEIEEGRGFSLLVTASDPDGSSAALRYRITSDEPGIHIHSTNGWLEWTSREGEGGRVIPVTVHVTDGGFPAASSSASFEIRVLDHNLPPSIPEIPARTVPAGEPYTQQIETLDADLPPQEMTYRLLEGAPEGMRIDAVSGLVTWTPGFDSAGQRLLVDVEVTDSGSPPLSARRTFSLQVLDTRPLPALSAVTLEEPLAGLTYAYYHGGWRALPDFGSFAPYKMGQTPAPDLALRERDTAFGFVFAGYLKIPAEGFYTFFAGARDAVRLSLGGETLLDIASSDQAGEGFAAVRLEAGFHPLRIDYLRTSSLATPVLHLEWEGPGLIRQAIPEAVLFTTFETLRDPDAPLDSDLDGIPDHLEALFGFDPHNPDSDGNGILDGLEDTDGDGIPNAFEIRYGMDPFLPDEAEGDADLDGLTFMQEMEANTDPFSDDTDGDGWNDETEITAGSDPLDPDSTPLHLTGLHRGWVHLAPAAFRASPVWIDPSAAPFGGVPVVVDPTPASGVSRPPVVLDTRDP